MENLEYRIGGLQINPKRLKLFNIPYSDELYAGHKFVVEALDKVVSIYVAEVTTGSPSDMGPTVNGAQGSGHKDVVKKFGMPEERIVGGGRFYKNSDNLLVLNDFSGDYGMIPTEVAQRFAKLMLLELERLGVKVKEIVAYLSAPFWEKLHSYWTERGFGSESTFKVK